MPFIRAGLCAVDQRKCATMLANGVDPREAAAKLHTTVDIVKQFTQEALDEVKVRNERAAVAATKHAKQTKQTATALAGAAKEILGQIPNGEFE